MACLRNCREKLSLATFDRIQTNSKETSFLSLQNKYPNLKNNFHVQPIFFLQTKLFENLLLEKYLLSVTGL